MFKKCYFFVSFFCILALSLMPSQGQCGKYSFTNPFWYIITTPSSAPIIYHSFYSLAFPDKKMRVRSHFLLIPTNPYSSFSHFIQDGKPEEFIDIIRSISKVADAVGVSARGYRVLTNHGCYLADRSRNMANQEIGHLHFHITGGECLGLPVAAVPNFDGHFSNTVDFNHLIAQTNQSILDENNNIISLPFPAEAAGDITNDNFQAYIQQNIYKQTTYTIAAPSGSSVITIVAFRVPHPTIQDYVGIVMLDENKNFKYESVDDLSRHGSEQDILHLIDFLKNLLTHSPWEKTGYRLYGNSGTDSWHNPRVFQLYIAGGVPLGPTVTNAHGNKRMGNKNKAAPETHFLYYKDLLDSPHDHCKKLLP